MENKTQAWQSESFSVCGSVRVVKIITSSFIHIFSVVVYKGVEIIVRNNSFLDGKYPDILSTSAAAEGLGLGVLTCTIADLKTGRRDEPESTVMTFFSQHNEWYSKSTRETK